MRPLAFGIFCPLTLVGSFKTVAEYFDRVAAEPDGAAVMLAFPDFRQDLVDFEK